MARYIVVRTDRIGDLILSLPVAEAIKESHPGAEVYYVTSPRTSEIARACPYVDGVIEYDETSGGIRQVLKLARAVKSLKAETVLILRPTFRVAVALVLAGVRRRVGTAYRLYSFLFNRPVKEHRKFAEQHEAEYNLSCVRVVLDLKKRSHTPVIGVDESAESFARDAIDQRGLQHKGFVIVHPGSGGSARNLTLRSFAKLADMVESEFALRVLVTAGEDEIPLVDEMDNHRSGESLRLTGIPRLLDLAAVIAQAKLFVSGSTGPMHLAAAMGTPTLSFFSPVRSCSPRRWGPIGGTASIVMPPVPECPTCKGDKCAYFDCMEMIEESRMAEALRAVLTAGPR
ncbi:MAG: glycosyltransferase family 9 protein [Candidatus Eisenbacteria bacterium]